MIAPHPLLIVGGGLAGSLAAIVMARTRPDVPILLLEAGQRFGGNHIWSYFDGDLPPGGAELVAALRPVHWAGHEVRFPGRERTLAAAYHSIRSEQLDDLVRTTLREEQYRLGAAVRELTPAGVVLEGGETIAAGAVIDARGPDAPMPGLDLGWQKFVGIEYRVPGHRLDRPIVMDATVEQHDGYRFVYSLPLAPDRLLIEDTYYSDSGAIDEVALERRIVAYAADHGWVGAEVHRERGVLPIVRDGDPTLFWPARDPVARLGVAGGFFHPTTGYSLGRAIANALDLARQREWAGAALASRSRSRFIKSWREDRYFRFLNRLLFGAARPEERYRIFKHFYRLDEAVIGRFYAGHLSLADKARILSGRPPVSLGRALRTILGKPTRS